MTELKHVHPSKRQGSSKSEGSPASPSRCMDDVIVELARCYDILVEERRQLAEAFPASERSASHASETKFSVITERILDHMAEISERLIELPATNLKAAKAKARVANDWLQEADGDVPTRLVQSLLKDVLAI